MNSCCLVGKLARHPVVRFEAESQITTFMLVIVEPDKDGASFHLYVNCVSWGRASETARVLQAEGLIALVGKLCWRKTTDKHEVVPA